MVSLDINTPLDEDTEEQEGSQVSDNFSTLR